jgi:two-component system chemotaxis sensor kinase CheA
LLLFRVGETGVMALPLSDVARLEEFQRGRIEIVGRQRMVQYRGDVLPLVDLSDAIDGVPAFESENLQVVVHDDHGHSVGVVVGSILDIVDQPVLVNRGVSRPGVLGAAVIQGRITDLVDIRDVVRRRVLGRAA